MFLLVLDGAQETTSQSVSQPSARVFEVFLIVSQSIIKITSQTGSLLLGIRGCRASHAVV